MNTTASPTSPSPLSSGAAEDTADRPLVSILVVSYNTREMTLECLRSVKEQTSVPYELIVVDNASADGSAEAIARDFPDLDFIASPDNLGFGAANNLAGERATGDYILLLNPDTIILDQAIDRLLAFAARTPEAKMWGGRTVFADGSPNPTNCYQAVTVWRLFCRAVGLSAITRNHPYFSTFYGSADMEQERQVDTITGCFLLLPRPVWEALGGFDPAFFLFDEETDLCMRAARDQGAAPRYTPEAVIVHHVGASMPSQAHRIIRQLDGRLLLVVRHFSGLQGRMARGAVVLMPAIRALAETLTFRRGTWREVWSRRGEWIEAGRQAPAEGPSASVPAPAPASASASEGASSAAAIRR